MYAISLYIQKYPVHQSGPGKQTLRIQNNQNVLTFGAVVEYNSLRELPHRGPQSPLLELKAGSRGCGRSYSDDLWPISRPQCELDNGTRSFNRDGSLRVQCTMHLIKLIGRNRRLKLKKTLLTPSVNVQINPIFRDAVVETTLVGVRDSLQFPNLICIYVFLGLLELLI